jgi:hypothetical protein
MRSEGALELPADLAVAAQKKDRHGSFLGMNPGMGASMPSAAGFAKWSA